MPNIVRGVGYTGTIQTLAWNAQGTTPVTAYLWGGGGAGGGNDTGTGGAGSGSGFSQINFTLQNGDVLQVAVGGAGGPGASGQGSAAGGFAGAGLVSAPIFDTRSAAAAPAVTPVFNPQYGSFLNTWGVWNTVATAATFDRTYTVFFPFSTEYTFTASAKNRAIVSVDGVERFFSDSSTVTFEQNITLTQGNHTVRIQAETAGGAGAVALTIDSGISYSGSRGGNAGASGSSGGGGGGGGATVLLLNSTVIAIAGGGGGGGGAGNVGSRNGEDAPGPTGVGGVGEQAGQNGQNKSGDGGGAGGGGGGFFGGNGGDCLPGDVGAQAGNFGTSFGGTLIAPNGRTPGGSSSAFYPGSAGRGGSRGAGAATNGYAAFEFDLTGIYVRDNVSFKPVQQVWIKNSGAWQPVQSVYIKYNDQWRPVLGATAPNFVTLSQAKMGVNPRLRAGENPQGGGGGGCKIICTKLHELGFLPDDIYAADQAFGEWLREHDPDAYNGYLHWARVVVDWMEQDGPQCMFWIRDRQQRNQRQQEMAIRWARRIALPWAQHMAYRMAAVDQDSRAGRWIMRTGLWVSRWVGRATRRESARKSAAIGYAMWAMFAVFWLLAGVRGR